MPAATLEIRDAGPLELDDEMIEFEEDFDNDPRDPQACFVPGGGVATHHESQVCGKKAA
jgi:hypothetical protein